ncbi:MAG: FtsQ-type POTRA domain-containing protein, partial [Firmicutes bacterium]|nr:FtsQ-type POTRA domain-containing protein [Bacillota bacterium]
MPEFEQRKRKSMTKEQLYEEYHNTDRKKSAKGASSKKNRGKAVKREAVPVSPERKIRQAQSDKKLEADKKAMSTARKEAVKKADRISKGKASQSGRSVKKKKTGKYTLYYMLLGIVVAAVLTVLSVTVLFNITNFEVTGEVSYSDEEIIDACGIIEGENLLRVDIGKAEEAIVTKLVYVDSAEIHRGFPNRLTIKVEAAKPVACFAYGSSTYYLVSAKGRLLEVSGSPSRECPLVRGYRPNLSDKAEVGLPLAEDEEKRIALAKTIIDCMEQNGLT